MKPSWRSVVVGLAYLGLVVFLILFCAKETSTFDEYSKYWGLFGTLVGVATGAIPSFFFQAQASEAKERAQKAESRAETIESLAPGTVLEQARNANPSAFR